MAVSVYAYAGVAVGGGGGGGMSGRCALCMYRVEKDETATLC